MKDESRRTGETRLKGVRNDRGETEETTTEEVRSREEMRKIRERDPKVPVECIRSMRVRCGSRRRRNEVHRHLFTDEP